MRMLEHFEFNQYPFALTPNPALFFSWPSYNGILNAVQFAIDRGEGIVKVVGEVGTGKTLLCRLLLNELD
ncbi:MAG: AAA family ATPase, partial [Alphaproteobacteria bacterium]|nr:AAA family ATPase [Alphaproteobacteria bacterium]